MPTRKTTSATDVVNSSRSNRTLRKQGAATSARLLATVPKLAEIGFQSARVDDVVRLAGVSHGTFYLYFSNMEDLFRAAARQCADEAAALAASLGHVDAGPDGREAVRAYVSEFLDFYRRHAIVVRAWTENQVTDKSLARLGATSFGRIVDTLKDAMADGSGATPREVELRAAALLALLERFSYIVTSRDLGFEHEALVDNLAAIVHRGFFAQRAA